VLPVAEGEKIFSRIVCVDKVGTAASGGMAGGVEG